MNCLLNYILQILWICVHPHKGFYFSRKRKHPSSTSHSSTFSKRQTFNGVCCFYDLIKFIRNEFHVDYFRPFDFVLIKLIIHISIITTFSDFNAFSIFNSYLKIGACCFLDASSHLYTRVCPSVGRSVGRSVGLSVCRSVGRSVRPSVGPLCVFSKLKKWRCFFHCFVISCHIWNH